MIIDAFEFARKAREASGAIAIENMRRLDVLGRSGSIAWSLAGSMDAKGRPQLQLTAQGRLMLACQRCLEPLVHEIDIESRLLLARSEEEAAAAPLDEAEPDVVVGSTEFDVDELVEDEVILSLPLVAKHERCGSANEADGVREEAAVSVRESPFAVLAGGVRTKARR